MKCYKCGVELTDENRSSSGGNKCKSCQSKYQKEYRAANIDTLRAKHRQWYIDNKEIIKKRSNDRHKAHRDEDNIRNRERNYSMGAKPMSENRDCPVFLGVWIAEQVLSKVFKNVKRMPYSNPGFDFICGKGYKIDAKSSCLHKDGRWMFTIERNQIADYFLCLAFDNRKDLTPLHLWLIPGDRVSHLTSASINPSTIKKWDEYKLDVETVVTCCNAIKEST